MGDRGKGRALKNEPLVDVRIRTLRGIEADINSAIVACQKRRGGGIRRREIRDSAARVPNESFRRTEERLANHRSVIVDSVRLELRIVRGIKCKELERAGR